MGKLSFAVVCDDQWMKEQKWYIPLTTLVVLFDNMIQTTEKSIGYSFLNNSASVFLQCLYHGSAIGMDCIVP